MQENTEYPYQCTFPKIHVKPLHTLALNDKELNVICFQIMFQNDSKHDTMRSYIIGEMKEVQSRQWTTSFRCYQSLWFSVFCTWEGHANVIATMQSVDHAYWSQKKIREDFSKISISF